MEIDQTQWSTTSIPGLEVRQDRVTVTAMRLWGWEGRCHFPWSGLPWKRRLTRRIR